MFRRTLIYSLLLSLAILGAGCRKNKVQNPIANVDSKQPDKVLFDRAMDALQHNKFDIARITLQTLINTYPDSEFLARAKLGVADSWFAEGGTTAMAQAEVEYKDFETFFPNLPEAAEAQSKVAGIHYKQMEKADRDYTHAKRAEDEYRQMIQQFPDSKLVPEAKQRLREIQEVLAEREYRIGRFYLLRQSWVAAIARLKSLSDNYPLYSRADEVLYSLGQAYEAELAIMRDQKIPEAQKTKILNDFTDSAAKAYAKIITRYPAMRRSDDARARLKELNRPVPTPTPEALAQNKAEEASRGETGRMSRVMANFKRRPDMAQAATVGEPPLEDVKPTNATDFLKDLTNSLKGDTENKATVETVKGDAAKENEPVPRSTPAPTEAPAPAPTQVNDAATSSSSSGNAEASSSSKQDTSSQNADSSSKKKKKKGIGKLNPF